MACSCRSSSVSAGGPTASHALVRSSCATSAGACAPSPADLVSWSESSSAAAAAAAINPRSSVAAGATLPAAGAPWVVAAGAVDAAGTPPRLKCRSCAMPPRQAECAPATFTVCVMRRVASLIAARAAERRRCMSECTNTPRSETLATTAHGDRLLLVHST